LITHYLKTWPYYFELMSRGVKTFEHRKNDRDFQEGDVLVLREWDPGSERYSGSEFRCRVSLVVRSAPGMPVGYCIMQTTALSPLKGGSDGSEADDGGGA
jgi:hypothetical protein